METLKLLLSTISKFFDWKTNKDSVDKYKSQSESLSNSSKALNAAQEKHRQELIDLEKSKSLPDKKRDYMENDW